MNNTRLIKKGTLSKPPQKQSTVPTHGGNGLNRAVKVVKDWVKERHITQQQQARQVFASLFAQPQS